jgi:hypothetical protein
MGYLQTERSIREYDEENIMPQPKDIIEELSDAIIGLQLELGSEKAASYVVIMRSASSTIKTLADGLARRDC